jgi:putative methanogenesis marker protein 6
MLVTKYVITSSESNILPSDIAMKIYGSKYDVLVKETCFGVIVNGEEEVVNALIKEIRSLDPAGIFIKDRGFPPGDPRRCRGRRGGGARPGFYMIESESKMLPMISRALASEDKEAGAILEKKKPLPIKRLEEIVKEG